MSKSSTCWNESLLMAANASPTPKLNASAASERYARFTLKQQLLNLLRDVFEGHREYLGLTPD
jgi:hypothetical protein